MRIFSLVDGEGWVRFHWRTTESLARRFAARFAADGDLLVGPTGRILATGKELVAS